MIPVRSTACMLREASMRPDQDVLSIRAEDLVRSGIEIPPEAVRACPADPTGMTKHVVDSDVSDAVELALFPELA